MHPKDRSTEPPPRRRGISLAGALSLVSIVFVLVLVSLPRLRAFVLVENAADARATVHYLIDEFALEADDDPDPRVGELLERSHRLRHALSDAEVLADGRLLRRHGYLFAFVPHDVLDRPAVADVGEYDVRPMEANAPRPRASYVVLAWPWRAEGTPLVVGTPEGALYSPRRHDLDWSGPDLDPAVLPRWEEWSRVD